MGSFFEELKKRRVYRVAIGYAIAAWLATQIAATVLPAFHAPEFVLPVLIVLLAVGFPVALVLAWAFDVTPSGVLKTPDTAAAKTANRRRGWLLGALGILVALLSLGGYWMFRSSRLSAAPKADAASSNEKSIAVLPFENRSEDKANAYFADGIQDEILTRLSKIADLKVISRTSTEHYKSAPENLSEIGKQLGVATVLEGSVQKSGDQVRVHVQLIKVGNDSHLWAETFDRKLTDIFTVESEVATAIADKLKASLTGSEQRALATKPTANLDAYDAYLHGITINLEFDATKLLTAADYLEQAVKLDPQFALAWTRLSRVYSSLYYQDFDTSPERREAARRATETVVRLAPEAVESYVASGYYRLNCERNLELAAQAFGHALQQSPNNPEVLEAVSIVDAHQGRCEDSLARVGEAIRLDPRNVFLLTRRVVMEFSLRRFPEALVAADQALQVTEDPQLIAFKADICQATGDLEQAAQLLSRLQPINSNITATSSKMRLLIYQRRYGEVISVLQPILAKPNPSLGIKISDYYALLSTAQRLAGDSAGARETCAHGRDFLLTEIQKSGGTQGYAHAMLGLLSAGLGEKAAALKEVGIAVELEGNDTWFAPAAQEMLARIEVQVGEKESALARLPQLLSGCYHSWSYFVPLTPARLRVDPVWDALRDDARFQQLCAGR